MKPATGETKLSFGAYRGRTLDEIAEINPGYIVWLAEERVLLIDRQFHKAARADAMEDDDLVYSCFHDNG